MIKSLTKSFILEEFLKLPETKPSSEYINGQIIQKPMPQGKHSILQGELVSNINSVTKPQKIALAFPELRCTYPAGSRSSSVYGGRSIVPDIAVFAWERILLDERGEVANVFKTSPDWTIEILSPDQSQTKVTGNILHCLKHGSRFGWLIDPDEHSVLVYPPKQQPELLQEEQEILPVPDLVNGFQLTVGRDRKSVV